MLSANPTASWISRVGGALCLGLLLCLSAVAQVEPGPPPAPESGNPGSAAPALPPPVPAVRQADYLAVLTIRGEIDAVTSRSIQRRLARVEAAGANVVVIELDTPGGSVGAVQEITAAIKGTTLHTIAWVNSQAISGGAIIAIACDEIVVSSNAVMGDAGVIDLFRMTDGIPANERAKITAPLIAEVVDSARRHGYDEVLVQSFLTLGVETWQVRDRRTGQSYFLTEREYRALFRESPPRDAEPFMAAGGELRLDRDSRDIYADDDGDGGRRGRTAREGATDGFVPGSPIHTPGMAADAQQSLIGLGAPASTRPNFSQQDPNDFEFVRYTTDGNAFLTLTTPGLRELGFAKAVINNDDELRQFTGTPAGQLARLDMTWSESLVKVLTQGVSGMMIRGILIVLFLLCLFIELSMPGTGVFGVIALAALAGLVVPPMMINASGWWPAVAVVLGVLLVLLEVMVMPGTAVAGVSGLALIVAGLMGTFAGTGELFPGQAEGSGANLAWAASIVLLGIFGAGVGMYLFSRYTKYIPIANLLILKDPPRQGDGMLAAMGPKVDPEAAAQVGDEGVTVTRLLPAGRVDINGRLVDAVAEQGAIDEGVPVRVVSATRYRISVEIIETAEAQNNGGIPA
ncbi:MAG: NfeD family protein [Phycisphaerales bacterium]